MKIGIVADIHGFTDPLRAILTSLRDYGVDIIVSLGDACDIINSIDSSDEIAGLLRNENVIGDWGNHDIGLCKVISEDLLRLVSPATLDYMSGFKPQLVVSGCRFSHVEPWLDANYAENLWYLEGPPDTAAKANRSFTAVPERHLFVGHYHCWMIMTPSGRIEWNGAESIVLNKHPRYLAAIAPAYEGWCAVFETESTRLIPLKCPQH